MLSLLLGACSSADGDLSRTDGSMAPTSQRDAAVDAAVATPPPSQRDAAMDAAPDGSSGGAAGAAGMPPETCTPSAERCNDHDDDCDGRTDEAEANDGCAARHTSSVCQQGACIVVECLDGYRDCDGDGHNGCEVAPDDPAHCGACGRACELPHASARCVEGQCVVQACDDGFDDCDGDLQSCEQALSELSHCGGCDVPCEAPPNATPSCASGSCGVDSCVGNFGDCNGEAGDGCELELISLSHCGGCGVPCDLGGGQNDCSAGVCLVAGCDVGFAQCDGDPSNGCESLSTAAHCGSCGALCRADGFDHAASASCEAAVCELQCEGGFGDCDENPFTGCESAVDNLVHCGGCELPCSHANALSDCATGSCLMSRCRTGFGDCNGDPGDGCETRLDSLSDCAGCGVPCELAACQGGVCSARVCTVPRGDCDADGTDCEVDLSNDVDHCGFCGNACRFTTDSPQASIACVDASCVISCEDGFADCDGDFENGCETPLDTLSDCGTCGTGCAVANGDATCAAGNCEIATCDVDYDDCDGDGLSCERALNTTSDCGGCGVRCELTNAVETCGGSPGARRCAIATCERSYYRDCDGETDSGCETDTRSDAAHCGACDNDCARLPHVAAAGCVDSSCTIERCDDGFGDCSGAPGCETRLDSLVHCGGCNTPCSRANASAHCQGGTCQIDSCDDGFDECDSSDDNGCEPLDTLRDCGACETPCSVANGDATCESGSCEVASCHDGFADCDEDAGNGCERDIAAEGPCAPDDNCVQRRHDDHIYWFCANARSWAVARALCAAYPLGDLVRIDNDAENGFVTGQVDTETWLGASDRAAEGRWRWAYNDVPFWLGDGSGEAILGRHVSWMGDEPNGGDTSDCAHILPAGQWRDSECDSSYSFVCEVNADRCPNDAAKSEPGQCGCGAPDVDGDGDYTADCNDGCPQDAAKTDPGACGCGVEDSDSDGDGFEDCIETCTTDPAKQDPGQCGCGVVDDDSDGDGVADCNDGCPFDATTTDEGDCDFDFTPRNIDPASLDPNAAGATTRIDCTAVLDTSSLTFTSYCAGEPPAVVTQSQAGGPELAIVSVNELVITAAGSLRVVGSRPLVLAVFGDATISGSISANANGVTPGPGGNVGCTPAPGNGAGGDGSGSPGRWLSDPNGGASGGGGGGFGSAGGSGGTADTDGSGNGPKPGGAGGAVFGSAQLVPLRGGCPGGRAGGCATAGGGGGGAIQIAAAGTLRVSGALRANGAQGATPCGATDEGGGTGGGSGGALLLEAADVDLSGAVLEAAGGWGGGNGSYDGFFTCGGSLGGPGSASAGTPGAAGGSCQAGSPGGGGGYGRLVVTGHDSCTGC